MSSTLSSEPRPTTPARPRRRPRPAARAPERPAFDRGYWLAHCEGYRVDSTHGRLGIVVEIRAAGPDGSDCVLAVRAGRLGRRLLLVPADEVAFIVPRARRIWLRSPVAIAGSEPPEHR